MPPGLVPEQETPDGQRRLAVLEANGFNDSQLLQYKREASAVLVHNGFTDEQLDKFWGDGPPASKTVTDATNGNLLQYALGVSDTVGHGVEQAGKDFGAVAGPAWDMYMRNVQRNVANPGIDTKVPLLASEANLATSVFTGVLNTITAPAARAAASLPATPATSPTSPWDMDMRPLAPGEQPGTTPTNTARAMTKDEAAQGYDEAFQTAINIALGATGGELAPGAPLPAGARAAAMEAFRRGEIRDPSDMPAAAFGAAARPSLKASIPTLTDYRAAAMNLIVAHNATPESLSRTMSNMQQIWVDTGMSPAQQASIARGNLILRQQLLTQDVTGAPTAPAITTIGPKTKAELLTTTARPTLAAEAEKSRVYAPTFVASVNNAMGLLRQLEGSGDQAVSPKGAMGRYQILPATARQYGFYDIAKLLDPEYNEQVARVIVSHLFQKYGGNMDAIAIAYNAGPGRANQYLSAGRGTRLEAEVDKTAPGGVRYFRVQAAKDEGFLPMETQKYLANARRRVGAPLSAEEGTGGQITAEAGKPGPWPGYDPNAKPESLIESEAEKEARGDTGLSAAEVWPHATDEDLIAETYSNIEQQRPSEVFSDYFEPNRFLSDFVSALTPFKAVDQLLTKEGIYSDPIRDYTTAKAFQNIHGADSTASSFILDGIVDFRTGTVVKGSPSVVAASQDFLKKGGTPEGFTTALVHSKSSEAATRFERQAAAEVEKARDAVEEANQKFFAARMLAEDDPKFKRAQRAKEKADAALQGALGKAESAKEKPGLDLGFNPFVSREVVSRESFKRIYGAAIEMFNKITSGALQYAVDAGRLSEKTKASYEWNNPTYVAFQRAGVDSRTVGFHELGESDRKIYEPVPATLDNIQWIVRQAKHAAAVEKFVQDVQKSPDLAAKIGLKREVDEAPTEDEIEAELKKYGFTEADMDKARDAFADILMERQAERLNPNSFYRWNKGVRETWSVADPYMAKALRFQFGAPEASALTKALDVAADVERTGIVFGLDWGWVWGTLHQGSQFIYDPLHPAPGVTMVRGFVHKMLNTKVAQDARASGALSVAMADMREDYFKNLRDDISSTGKTPAQRFKDYWRDEAGADTTWNNVLWPVQFSRMISEIMDESNRIGLFAQSRRARLSNEVASARSLKTGLDFKDRGMNEIGRLVTRASPMYTAFLKGSEQWVGALKTRGVSTMGWALGTYGTATLVNFGLNWLQDHGKLGPAPPPGQRFSDIPNADKDRYLITPQIAGHRIHLRNPPGAPGFVVSGLLQRVLAAYAEHDPHAFEGALWDFLQENLRGPSFALTKPFEEAIANHNAYTGHPIIPDSLKGNAPQDQFQPFTTMLSRNIANVLDYGLGHIGASQMELSPMQLDYLIKGYTGPAGMKLLSVLGPPPNPGAPTDFTDMPGLSRIWERNPGVNSKAVDNFYLDKARFDQAFNERVTVRRAQRGEAYAQWITKSGGQTPPPMTGADPQMLRDAIADQDFAARDRRLNQVSGALGVQRDALYSIYASDMPDVEKRQHSTAIITHMIQAATTASAEMTKFEAAHNRRAGALH